MNDELKDGVLGEERQVDGIDWVHRLLLNESPDPIFAFARNGEYLYVNRAFAQGVQRSVEQIIHHKIWDVFPKAEADKRYAALNAVFQSGLEKVIEVRVPRTDCDRYYVTTITPIKDADGQVSTVICSSKDITDRKQIELALAESEEINRAISGLTTDYIFIVDLSPEGQPVLRWASANLLQITGRTLSESATPQQWQSIIHPEDLQAFQAFMQHTLQSGESSSFECRSRIQGGGIRWVQIYVQPQFESESEGKVTSIYGAVKDISRRKQAELALRESEARGSAFMEFVPALILIKDQEFRPIFANTRFCQLFPFEAWKGKTPHETFPAEIADRMLAMDVQAMEQGSVTYDEMATGEDSVPRNFRTTKFRIDLAGASPLLGVIILDTTDQKQAELAQANLQAQFLQAQKMESVGRLAGGVAHDFNNMLQAILGYTELALAQAKPGQSLHTDLEQIQKTARRSADLTRQLLAFARKQTVTPQVLDLNETVSGILSMLHRLIGEDIELCWRPAAKLWPIRMDPSQIDQVLANLCVNARDAIQGVGRITIETINITMAAAHGQQHPECLPGDYVKLVLSDTGCGMPGEVLQHLFEPFFTTKEIGQGTGLGLATVYGIVKQNEGFIQVSSQPGHGSRFEIFLPRTFLSSPAETEDPARKEPTRGKETVLVVEDEPVILEMCQIMLEKLGYRVLTSCNPREAFNLAAEHGDPIDLLLTDVVLPEMNGRELGQRLRVHYPQLRHLYMSGYTSDVIAPQGIQEEGLLFIQKPFSMRELSVRIREALDQGF